MSLAEHMAISSCEANASRRNGKPASCEPCRINKTRCDHGRPKCDRCKQRGIEERCFYHPAPLTKPRPADDVGTGESRPLKRKRPSRPSASESVFPITSTSPNDKLADAVAADVYHPGFLGPGSYAVLLPQDEEPDAPREREVSVASERSDWELTHQHPLTKSMRYQMASDVLNTFRYFPAIKELLLWYNASNEAGVVPAPLQVDAILAIESIVDKHNLGHAPPSPQLISQVLECTSRPFTLAQNLEPRDFHILCSGENLRFETIGFLLATAGRSLTFGFVPDLLNDPANRALKSQFTDELLRASTTCLFLCTMLATVNDITVWMYYENYLFTTMMCGYAGPPSWRRLGELSTQIYALGIHKESTSANVPLWLRETRKRLFTSSYNQDKAISTFLGRPIRISKRHTDISLPLDISDEETVGDRAGLSKVIESLDQDGWNTDGRWRRASWIRLRYKSLQFREEVLEFSMTKLDDTARSQLLDISGRLRACWGSLPPHLRYWKSCWDEDTPPTVCLMLIIVHLTHWYTEFMIQKLLDYTPLTSNQPLLRVSIDLLSNVLTLGTVRDRSYDVHRDMLHCVLLFGVPAASVLATALREQQATSAPFPPDVSRSEIVRMLSVLISHLDAAAHVENSGARQGEANYNLCRKASKIFTKVIDAVLEPRNGSEVTPSGLEWDFDFSGPGLDGFESLEFSGLGPLGLSGNMGVNNAGSGDGGIDWGAVGQWSL
ncbi:hypothetical protein HBH98_088140 [Parastagonospora nodorum]|nr:hypothetical protein HBH51_090600 [Parastagonospora nodorum]KAH3999715.1 hypothetical protein HBI10_114920 [Parastagonospora nodorum]KAH4013195.1 hypothetical protein HBI13_180970 [Parastagonospora nodorum]KAH4035263.1 hypothetical protein HBI09_097370 [Parastagonospora nodorum]KAH4048736.1 hypothetical protein HBH49_150630 [Parastagonospora nodorum]